MVKINLIPHGFHQIVSKLQLKNPHANKISTTVEQSLFKEQCTQPRQGFIHKTFKWLDTKVKAVEQPCGPHVKFPVTLEERRAFAKNFKEGDIVFLMLPGAHPDTAVELGIVRLQKISRLMGLAGKHPHNNTDTDHVFIVTKVTEDDVWVSEATPSKKSNLRTVSLIDHKCYILTKEHENEYYYVNFTPEEAACVNLAEKAAKIGLRLSPKVDYLREPGESIPEEQIHMKSGFSFPRAFKAIFSKGYRFKHKEQARVFRMIYEESTQALISMSGKKPQSFFCSMFCAQLYQRAEGKEAWEKMVQAKPELQTSLDQLILDTKDLKPKQRAKTISKWSKAMAKKEGGFLANTMKHFKFNPTKMGPSDFYDYLEKSKIMKKVIVVTAPSA
ncbi:putative uncharacterized protein [Parachlamydia acanthamoebae UV-7]|uniref:Uncharacterized protein n=2 Tax=Parachlamydia acanthamoebae TaxID=83552 RepID=F8KYB9_PARAV|nr:hypothetical protein [Parachlamydia acanthamoebae]KIA78406.1 hypothetical protein DB43_EA00030 [Parachlamydia acanthamoebae]CCB85854.1 putative uncharacterized protein [Parachlamydia acanthamoebae UV-7]